VPWSERGQTSTEYAGLLVLIALLLTALFQLDLPARIAAWAGAITGLVDSKSAQVVAGTPGAGGAGTSPGGTGARGADPGGGRAGPGGGRAGPGGGGAGPGGGGAGPGGGGGRAGGSGTGPGGTGTGPGGTGTGPGGSGSGGPGATGTAPARSGSGGPGATGTAPARSGSGGPGATGTAPGGSRSGGPGATGTGPDGRGGGAGNSGGGPCAGASGLGDCLKGGTAANKFDETFRKAAQQRYRDAAEAFANSDAKPGTPEYSRLKGEFDRAQRALTGGRRYTDNPVIRNLSRGRRYIDPRYKDVENSVQRFRKGFASLGNRPGVAGKGAQSAATASKSSRAVSRVLGGLGKFGEGLGVVGVGLSGYSNVSRHGVGKGLSETIGGAALAYGVGAVGTAACAAITVGTAGVGAVCAVGVVGATVAAGKIGTKLGGAAYDHVINPVGHAAARASKPVRHAVGSVVSHAGSLLTPLAHLKPGFL
jgi:hypothetical protein